MKENIRIESKNCLKNWVEEKAKLKIKDKREKNV